MIKAARPFVASLKSILQHQLPAGEIEQILDESNWEFEKLAQYVPGEWKTRNEAHARFCSLCVSFYRAMLSVGIDKHSASSTISRASSEIDWTPIPAQDSEDCSVAQYFNRQSALNLCEATFCRRCPRNDGECSALRSIKTNRA